MKKPLLTIATVVTISAAGTSVYLATLPNPTDIQEQLGDMTNQIAIAGTAAIFGLLNDEDEDNSTNP